MSRETIVTCDRCGRKMDRAEWDFGGNCTTCGDNLCVECSGHFGEDGQCKQCHDEEASFGAMILNPERRSKP